MLYRSDVTRDDVLAYMRTTRNWGRWGDDDQRGAINLVDSEKRRGAAALVRTGESLSLSRPVPVQPAQNNPRPATMEIERFERPPDAGGAKDFQGMSYHGSAATHIDALCHAWDADGMWGGRDPDNEVSSDRSNWGAIEHWKDGILTRGVLIDVPAYRGTPFVTEDEPVHGGELQAIVEAQGITVEPGDALVIYCGREEYERQFGGWNDDPTHRPGLEATCLQFIRESDCAALLWDMWDTRPGQLGFGFTTHAAIFAYGVAVVDAALLQPLSQKCQELGRYDFMLTLNPLVAEGATGSLINPVATF